MAFTEQEKAQIRRLLSYPSWLSLAQSIQLGYPAASQPLFLLDDAFNRMRPEAEELIRYDMCECMSIERQLSDSRGRFKASQVGNIKMNPQEPAMLRKELLYWTTRLGDDLGVVPDPYSRMMYEGIANMGGVNSSVR